MIKNKNDLRIRLLMDVRSIVTQILDRITQKVPIICSNVWIGSSAKIFGDKTIAGVTAKKLKKLVILIDGSSYDT